MLETLVSVVSIKVCKTQVSHLLILHVARTALPTQVELILNICHMHSFNRRKKTRKIFQTDGCVCVSFYQQKYTNFVAGSKSGDYEEIHDKPFTKLLANGSLLLQHVKEDREGFYLCQAHNGIGTGIGKVIQLKVNCKSTFMSASKSNWLNRFLRSVTIFFGAIGYCDGEEGWHGRFAMWSEWRQTDQCRLVACRQTWIESIHKL